MHWCANLVCLREGSGSAVLLRGVEPLEGLDVMRHRRGVELVESLCSGPGRLCQALGINRSELDGRLMRGSPVEVMAAPDWSGLIEVTPRIGITKAAEWPLRFTAAGSRFVSRRSVTSKLRAVAREHPPG
jgi:DNA-3-methyladenine glycosylase